jgi:hypothetical protein
MKQKRKCNIMLRLTEEELAKIEATKPSEIGLATHIRQRLLVGVSFDKPSVDVRQLAAFIVAALSTELGFEEALAIFDEHFGKGA